ncbi:MAG: hypothetical protein NMK33_05445 [Candidatus Cardinium sp.]|uniref:hypothetical protein n=1 Tax=Cardinium endosymbiont of Dermatophagoides farinae TaxID=2597823 RepID=UPI001183280C|nr:hypothetical protein [Cardinium endosymbiont of Dermatophagoides farinae]TSJ80857.1 hypothetical protein FPG78_02250 [Cardinium endosymbiont of Dermatophagoides farinae]UWW96862.1 MAG: hypothetical protein NMK33_05445 [Candidatus Cardinium sp.]
MIKHNLKKYLFFILACTLGSCQQYTSIQSRAHLYGLSSFLDLFKIKRKESSISKYEKLASRLPAPKFFVVLLPSCEAHTAQTDTIRDKLVATFGEDVMVVQIQCIAELKQKNLTIKTLGEKVYDEMVDRLSKEFKARSLLKLAGRLNLPMHIFSYGPGNLLACIKKENDKFLLSLGVQFNIQTLSTADVVEHQNAIKEDSGIQLFENNEDKSISDYIAFLKEQQAKSG